MVRRVIVTGSEGTVGRVLTGRTSAARPAPSLAAHVTGVDRFPATQGSEHRYTQQDLTIEASLFEVDDQLDVLVHAAWAPPEGILRPQARVPANVAMARRVLNEAVSARQNRPIKVILLGSVNAHVPWDWLTRRERGRLISVDEDPTPNRHNRAWSPGGGYTCYGRSKLAIEALGRRAASAGVHVVALRLGGVNLFDLEPSTFQPYLDVAADAELGQHFDLAWESAVWLRHVDLVRAVQHHVDSPVDPGTFELSNLVSDGPSRAHEIP